MPNTIEVAITANPKHKGIVDIKVAGNGKKDETGAVQGKNGIRWVV